jgi:hypothetical protein
MIGRRTLLTILALAALLAPALGYAQSSGGTGIGVVLGEPTGVTARFMSGGNNFQVHAAWSFSGDAAVQLNGDYLRSGRLDTDPMMPFYFGLGARVKFADDAVLGIRIPLGVSHFFKSDPFEVFAELVPILDLVPDTEFDFNGAVGIRYFFRKANN